MIRAVLFDLGDTLETDGRLLPGAVEALEGVAGLSNAGARLKMGLISDYTMPPAGAGPERIDALFREYVEIVRRLGLLRFFEPPEQHVTLSTHAGVLKPDAKIFQLALRRLGIGGDVTAAIFITEDADHVRAAKKLGMTGLQYGSASGIPAWSSAVPTIRRILEEDRTKRR